MKKILIPLLFILLLSNGCGGKKPKNELNILGEWTIETITGETLSDAEKKTVFVFKVVGDGIKKYSITQNEVKQEGKWELNGKTIQLIPADGSVQLLKNVIQKSNALIFENEGKTITLQRK